MSGTLKKVFIVSGTINDINKEVKHPHDKRGGFQFQRKLPYF